VNFVKGKPILVEDSIVIFYIEILSDGIRLKNDKVPFWRKSPEKILISDIFKISNFLTTWFGFRFQLVILPTNLGLI